MQRGQFRIAALGFVAIVLLSSRCRALDPNSPANRVQKLLDTYRLLHSVHYAVRSIHDFKMSPPGFFHIEGSQEYWADGENYRICQSLASQMFPGLSHDLRWDGGHFQWFSLADSTLVFSQYAHHRTPYISVPLFLLPLAYLRVDSADPLIKTTLADLQHGDFGATISKARSVGDSKTEIELPGENIGDTEFTIRVEFADATSILPTRVRRHTTEGVDISTTELQYKPVRCGSETIQLPCWARLTNRTFDNQVFVVAELTADSIDVGPAIPAQIFTLDYQRAKTVVNLDAAQIYGPDASSRRISMVFNSPEAQLNAQLDSGVVPTGLLASVHNSAAPNNSSNFWPLCCVIGGAMTLVPGLVLTVGARRKKRGVQ